VTNRSCGICWIMNGSKEIVHHTHKKTRLTSALSWTNLWTCRSI